MFTQTELDARYEEASERFALYTRMFDDAEQVTHRKRLLQEVRDLAVERQHMLCRLMDDELDVMNQVTWDYAHRAMPVWDRAAGDHAAGDRAAGGCEVVGSLGIELLRAMQPVTYDDVYVPTPAELVWNREV